MLLFESIEKEIENKSENADAIEKIKIYLQGTKEPSLTPIFRGSKLVWNPSLTLDTQLIFSVNESPLATSE